MLTLVAATAVERTPAETSFKTVGTVGPRPGVEPHNNYHSTCPTKASSDLKLRQAAGTFI